jgi:hypothetical protein
VIREWVQEWDALRRRPVDEGIREVRDHEYPRRESVDTDPVRIDIACLASESTVGGDNCCRETGNEKRVRDFSMNERPADGGWKHEVQVCWHPTDGASDWPVEQDLSHHVSDEAACCDRDREEGAVGELHAPDISHERIECCRGNTSCGPRERIHPKNFPATVWSPSSPSDTRITRVDTRALPARVRR